MVKPVIRDRLACTLEAVDLAKTINTILESPMQELLIETFRNTEVDAADKTKFKKVLIAMGVSGDMAKKITDGAFTGNSVSFKWG